jgi:hypothetical protein
MAERMYRDESSIVEVREKQRMASDYQDLTLIDRRQLALVDPDVGFGSGKAQHYFPPGGKPVQLSTDEASAVRMEVLEEIRERSRARIAGAVPGLSLRESSFIVERIQQALALAFSRGILKTL